VCGRMGYQSGLKTDSGNWVERRMFEEKREGGVSEEKMKEGMLEERREGGALEERLERAVLGERIEGGVSKRS
jgi:hypothetical protein